MLPLLYFREYEIWNHIQHTVKFRSYFCCLSTLLNRLICRVVVTYRCPAVKVLAHLSKCMDSARCLQHYISVVRIITQYRYAASRSILAASSATMSFIAKLTRDTSRSSSYNVVTSGHINFCSFVFKESLSLLYSFLMYK